MDIGYCKKTGICLKQIGVIDKEDQLFLYEIILFRWRNKEIVNIQNKTPNDPPTFDQHVSYLQKNFYKKIYKVLLYDVVIGTIYFDINNTFSIFIIPGWLKTALKQNKFTRKDDERIGTTIINMLMELNKDVETFYLGINVKNKASINTAKELNCIPLEIVYKCYNKYKSGG